MKIIVAGGAGYIGSHVVFELIDQGHEVTIFDDMSLGSEKNIDPRANFVKGSTMAESDLDSVCQDRFDCMLHFAAWKAAGESMTNPGKYAKNNLNGTINLINACDRYDIEYFIFSSSAAVYGMPEYLPVDENHPLKPSTINTTRAGFQPNTRKTFVPPAFPLPCSRISIPRMNRPIIILDGMDPAK